MPGAWASTFPPNLAQTSYKSLPGPFFIYSLHLPTQTSTRCSSGFFLLLIVYRHPSRYCRQPRRATSARLGYFSPLPLPPPTLPPNPAQTSDKRSWWIAHSREVWIKSHRYTTVQFLKLLCINFIYIYLLPDPPRHHLHGFD
jgi:hypothetical protein